MNAVQVKDNSLKSNLSIVSKSSDLSLFTKVEVEPGLTLFDFNEEELCAKFEKLMNRFDSCFKTGPNERA